MIVVFWVVCHSKFKSLQQWLPRKHSCVRYINVSGLLQNMHFLGIKRQILLLAVQYIHPTLSSFVQCGPC